MDTSKSLRKGKKRTGNKALKIGAPQVISTPQAANNTISLKDAQALAGGVGTAPSSRPSTASTTATKRDGAGPPASLVPGVKGPPGGAPKGMPGANPRPRPKQNDQTADLVKRRYSTRFTQLPQNFDAPPPMPAMPTIPSAFTQPKTIQTESGRKIQLDPTKVLGPNFDVDSYLKGASETDKQMFGQEVMKMKQRMDSEQQHNMFVNRTQFVKISKEADRLRDELRTLKTLMSDLTGTLNQVNIASGVSTVDQATKRSNRSSVANLEALWSSHLQELWRRVEGSQKYLPATPGRHVVYESGRWLELNSATWKPRRRVHIILLNDHLLIATDKKTAQANDPREKQQPAQIVALKCWPLQDVQIADLAMRGGGSGGSNASNSINLRSGPDSLTFATATKDLHEKASLLSNFKKASEDLRRSLEAESLAQEKLKKSSATGDLASPTSQTTFGDSFVGSRDEVVFDIEGRPFTLREVEAQIDQLDIDSAIQKFDDAVGRLEQLRRAARDMRSNSAAQMTLNRKLDERAAKLAITISRFLGQTHAKLTATKRNVDWLFRLGFEDRAREVYLEARGQIIQKRIRQVIFSGDLHIYIYQISYIYFTIIKHTAQIFQDCFPMSMLSACVKWAKGHVDDFNALLIRQLSGVDSRSEEYKACMARAHTHASMLAEVGMDFKNLLGETNAG